LLVKNILGVGHFLAELNIPIKENVVKELWEAGLKRD